MSDNIMNSNEFFSDNDIPRCVKEGVIALALGGTYDPNAKNMKGSKVFNSILFRKGAAPTPVIHEYNSGCIENNASLAQLRGMGCHNIFGENLNVLFDGTLSDKEICEKLSEASQSYYNMSADGKAGNYQNSRESITDTLKIAREMNPEGVKVPVVDNLLACLDEAFSKNNDKKKQITAQTM